MCCENFSYWTLEVFIFRFSCSFQNSGYEPTDVYGFTDLLRPEATPPTWPNRSQQLLDPNSRGLPSNSWDTEPDTPEEGSGSETSSIDHRAGSWEVKPWTGSPQSVQPIKPPTGIQQQPSVTSGGSDSAGGGLVVGEVGKLDIPDQIWVPESGGVEQHYPGPFNPRTITTSMSATLMPSLLLITISFLLLRR